MFPMSRLVAADRAPSSLASWSMSGLPELQDDDALGLPFGGGGHALTGDEDEFEQTKSVWCPPGGCWTPLLDKFDFDPESATDPVQVCGWDISATTKSPRDPAHTYTHLSQPSCGTGYYGHEEGIIGLLRTRHRQETDTAAVLSGESYQLNAIQTTQTCKNGIIPAYSTSYSPLSPVHSDRASRSETIAGENRADSNYGQISPVHQSSLAGSIASLDPPNPVGLGAIGRSPRGQDEPGKATTEPSLTASSTISRSPKRKRKPNRRRAKTTTTSRKSIAASAPDPTDGPADTARNQALEKNRRAAGRCRHKKKLHVGQLQENVRVQKAEHAFLKEQIMSMKEQVQQLAALLVVHAGEDSRKSSPGEIQ